MTERDPLTDDEVERIAQRVADLVVERLRPAPKPRPAANRPTAEDFAELRASDRKRKARRLVKLAKRGT